MEKNKAEETCRETSRIRLGGREIKKGEKMEREKENERNLRRKIEQSF